MAKVPNFPTFPKQPKESGEGGRTKLSTHWQNYRAFVTKHNTKLVLLWAVCFLSALGYSHYEFTQGRGILEVRNEKKEEEEDVEAESQISRTMHDWIIKLGLNKTTRDMYKK